MKSAERMLTWLRCLLLPIAVRARAAARVVWLATPLFVSHTAWASITGVCPDGSVFIVRSAADIPCKGAKQMAPDEVPPLRPEYLPRPYTWEIYEAQGNPNNPYNLIDAARKVRALRQPASSGGDAHPPAEGVVSEHRGGAPGGASGASPPSLHPIELGFSDAELRDLFQIVEFSQPGAPATFRKQTADGRDLLRVAFAHSRSFEAHLADRLGQPIDGPVLLFSAGARQPQAIADAFIFVQGHLAFHPRADDAAQMGILQGRLGHLDAGEAALGYVVLPRGMDVRAPMDVYWNDRRLTVTFRPEGR